MKLESSNRCSLSAGERIRVRASVQPIQSAQCPELEMLYVSALQFLGIIVRRAPLVAALLRQAFALNSERIVPT